VVWVLLQQDSQERPTFVLAIALDRAPGVTSIISKRLQTSKLYRLYGTPAFTLIWHRDCRDIAAQERMTHARPIRVAPGFADAGSVGMWHCWAIIGFGNVNQGQICLLGATMNAPGPHLSCRERNVDFVSAWSYVAKAMKCSQNITAGQQETCAEPYATVGDFDPVISASRVPFGFSHVRS
jgi:hypothetical protein